MCMVTVLETMLDKSFQRQVKSLHVFCHHKDRGCGWQGEIFELERHIQSCPMRHALLFTDQFLYVSLL